MNKSTPGKANGIVEQAKQTVANVAVDAKAGVENQLEQRIDQAKEAGVEKIETVSEAIRGAGEKLDGAGGTGPLPELVEKAAEGIDNLARFIENKSIGDLFGSLQSFAKREPAVFLGGALAFGMIAGRLLKSSSRRSAAVGDRYETFGFDEQVGVSEGDLETDDYLAADDVEEDWDTGVSASDEPLAYEQSPRGDTSNRSNR